MRIRFWSLIITIAAAGFVLFLVPASAIGQSATPATDIPRLANGKPDFSGVWARPRVTDITRDARGCGSGANGCTQKGSGELSFTPFTERLSYIDANHIGYDLTIEDPKIYTRPIKNSRTWVRMKPGEELLEYWCMENNKDVLEGHLDLLRDATFKKYFGID